MAKAVKTEEIFYYVSRNRFGHKTAVIQSPAWEKILSCLNIFGNKPIIIDEPETHLDQKIIASEMVDVIKKVKTNKQIIFATHNANIVINADAEQVYILTTGTDGKTILEQMSIEDVYENDKREKLLMLEGSEQAFKKREKKYSLQ